MNITIVNDRYAVSPQIEAHDIATIAAKGYVAVICNRPDFEDPEQPTAADIAAACGAAGLSFYHLPVSGTPLNGAVVLEQRQIIENSNGPVLAYCRSGQRSSLIWQASA